MGAYLSHKTVLLVGASRGLGFAMAEEHLKRGDHVIATARTSSKEGLYQLAKKYPDSLEVEIVDITDPEQVNALYARLSDRHFDTLFVNAGVSSDDHETVADISTEEFIRIMVTNSLSPMRVIEKFQDLVLPAGTIGVMSSDLGSVTNNTEGGLDVYRSSKAALNMFMRSYVARHGGSGKTFLLMAPGWVKTDMGGDNAPLTVDDSIPPLLNTMKSYAGRTGLHFLDYQGNILAW